MVMYLKQLLNTSGNFFHKDRLKYSFINNVLSASEYYISSVRVEEVKI